MLARVLKKEEAAAYYAPLAVPEIGDPNAPNQKMNQFVIPDISNLGAVASLPVNAASGFVDSNASVDDILQQARMEAARIIAEAEQQSQILALAAQEKAITEARQMFEAEIAQRVSDLRGQLTDTITQIGALSNEIASSVEPEVVELALQIARKIVGREVTIDREVCLTLVKVSLAKLHNRSVAEVHLNPEDFNYVETHREKLDFRGSLQLVADKSVSLGGCLIHTETGDIDGRIESQFDEIAQGLLGK